MLELLDPQDVRTKFQLLGAKQEDAKGAIGTCRVSPGKLIDQMDRAVRKFRRRQYSNTTDKTR